ncbi:lactosylceramide 4-alpha-galactosyltransferase-like isoform X2 [Convolutriloba macropyga]|uniref:lactosylceramide 4-alpha-galactosyltransferase-like isoform X2 n=1 Tax=Convolutriloba macropyga TaxID=536237 RepID=UPI003F520A12
MLHKKGHKYELCYIMGFLYLFMLAMYSEFYNFRREQMQISLPEFDGVKNSVEKQIFFVETSGRSYLRGRDCCAIESASRNSGLRVQILFTSGHLNLSRSNCSAELYRRPNNIHFYTVNVSKELKGTQVEGIGKKLLQDEKLRNLFLSDIIRIVLVYKYGGFYSDLDSVVIHNLENLTNVVGAEQVSASAKRLPEFGCFPPNGSYEINLLNGAHIHLEKGHPLGREILEEIERVFHARGKRNHIGPPLVYKGALHLLNMKKLVNFEAPRLSILPFFSFNPVYWARAAEVLWRQKPLRSTAEWDDMFACSYIVHFYGYMTRGKSVRGDDPLREAYSYLAPKHCPISLQPPSEF